ncbi:MAG: ParB/RepB/Spo0J family partition protein [Litoreibacter sp.]
MKDKKTERRGLGRGLSALMADVDVVADVKNNPTSSSTDVNEVPVELVFPNPDQPRKDFTEADLSDLAASIRDRGIIQPLIVRADPERPNSYQIVAGERRWRAAQRAQLHTVPVVVREFSDTEVLEVAIIENVQRADLNPVEEALGYRQLQDRFGHTQEQMATALGKSRSYIANILRLLNLPEEILIWVREGKLSSGHARALITSDNAVEIAKQVIAKNLSVRETEKLVKKVPVNRTATPISRGRKSEKDADTRALEDDLTASLGMKVSIDHQSGDEKGSISISYRDFSQLDELCRRLADVS